MTLLWAAAKSAFVWDGSWRDIYVLDTDRTIWNVLLSALQAGPYAPKLFTGGSFREGVLPDIASLLVGDGELSTLRLHAGPIVINCHFFDENVIEFDIDPREIDEQTFPKLIEFMSFVSQAASRPCVLCEENWVFSQHLPPMMSLDTGRAELTIWDVKGSAILYQGRI